MPSSPTMTKAESKFFDALGIGVERDELDIDYMKQVHDELWAEMEWRHGELEVGVAMPW